MMERRESASWILNIVLGVIGVMSAAGGYHLYMNSIHEDRGTPTVSTAAILMHLESRNQSLTNMYTKRRDEGDRVEQSQQQLDRLEYDRGGIKSLKHAVLGESSE
jgi:hypothetical protein